MSVDEQLLSGLLQNTQFSKSDFKLIIENKIFSLIDVLIKKSTTPVRKPTTRGGVYFSEKDVFKITGKVEDLSVIPLISKVMLGPNAEFSELEIQTKSMINDQIKNIKIFTNLTNSMETSSFVELHMIITKTNSN